MSATDTDRSKLDVRRREMKPARIVIGGKAYLRNDVQAEAAGESVKTQDKRDALGAPYCFFGGVKYRPEKEYGEFIAAQIRTKNQPPQRQRRTSQRRR